MKECNFSKKRIDVNFREEKGKRCVNWCPVYISILKTAKAALEIHKDTVEKMSMRKKDWKEIEFKIKVKR